VLGNLPRDPLHVEGFPCKHIKVCFEEVDERTFLFRIERDDHILDVLGGLERAGLSLGRLGDILVLGSRLDEDPLGPDDFLSELKSIQHRTRMRADTLALL
jgi:hypothetical protein